MQNTAKPAAKGLTGLKKKRRIQVVLLTFLALIVASGLIGYALRDGMNYFRSPSEVAEKPPEATEVFRIGGLVKEGTIRAGTGMEFFFTVTDGGADIDVHYIGTSPRPDLFSENTGTIATGTLVNGVFVATDILAKHDETYMPKEVMDALKEQGVYQDPKS